jgi:hypothetical protein
MVGKASEANMEIDDCELHREEDENVHCNAGWSKGSQLSGRYYKSVVDGDRRKEAQYTGGHPSKTQVAYLFRPSPPQEGKESGG